MTHGLGEPGMLEDRFLKRLRKKARKGLREWPIATVAFYGPNLHQATKVAVGIVPSENAEVEELRAWIVDRATSVPIPTLPVPSGSPWLNAAFVPECSRSLDDDGAKPSNEIALSTPAPALAKGSVGRH